MEFETSDYPDERLIACRNPLIAEKNQKQREALLQATEQELYLIVKATQREKGSCISKGFCCKKYPSYKSEIWAAKSY